ncbi:hypothetical protein DXG01_008688 [Tephrocybe rancida]|nr:hypothetical protein DXG01_008688 [Tephrocybe rancida]
MPFRKGRPNIKASSDIDAFRKVLRKAKRIVVLAGPGISSESSPDGETSSWQLLEATPGAFSSNPSLVWQLYQIRRRSAARATPTALHTLLAELSVPSFRKAPSIAPKSKSYHLITASTDRLLPSALASLPRRKLGVQNPRRDALIQMHGGILDMQCTACDWRAEDVVSSLCAALAEVGVEEGWDPSKRVIPVTELPHCPACGALARPGVVLAGERPPRLAEIDRIVRKADLCLVVGASLARHPAATYVAHMRERGGCVAVFAQSPVGNNEGAGFLFEGPYEEVFPQALGAPFEGVDFRSVLKMSLFSRE